MATLALILYAAYLLLAFGLRTLIQLRRGVGRLTVQLLALCALALPAGGVASSPGGAHPSVGLPAGPTLDRR